MDTKRRIIREACREFAEKGYDGATIRAICRRAGVNLASVNYHFSSKETLYKEVFAFMMDRDKKAGVNLEKTWNGDFGQWRKDLEAWLQSILTDISSGDPLRRYKCLIFGRELLNPSPVFHKFFSNYMKPILDQIACHMGKVLPKDIPEDDLYTEVFSVVSECVFYLHTKAIVQARFPGRDFTSENLSGIVRHSVEKTCVWIKHRSSGAAGDKAGRRRTR